MNTAMDIVTLGVGRKWNTARGVYSQPASSHHKAYPWVTPPTLTRHSRRHQGEIESVTRSHFDLLAWGYISTMFFVIVALVTYWMVLTNNEDLHVAWIVTAGCFTLVTFIVSYVVRDMFNKSIEEALGVQWVYSNTASGQTYGPVPTASANGGMDDGVPTVANSKYAADTGVRLMPRIDRRDIVSTSHRSQITPLF